MKIDTDARGDKLLLVVPTKEEFDEWVTANGFTTLMELLDGYSIVDQAHKKATDELSDPEMLVADAIALSLDEIEKEIYNLFVCAFKYFAEKKGGAK